MLPNRVCVDWQKYLHFYLSGSVMVTIESQWYGTETHCDQGTERHLEKNKITEKFIFSNYIVCIFFLNGIHEIYKN